MKEQITASRQQVVKAYNAANSKTRRVLEHLFGADTFRPADVRERVKTFEDAIRELGTDHPYVSSYKEYSGNEADVIAYLKLRIITAALNEGWEPRFTEGEIRHYLWLGLLTKDEYDRLSDDKKGHCALRPRGDSNSFREYVYFFTDNYYSGLCSSYGARLAFKTEKLALYAAKQFIGLWVQYIYGK